MARASGRDILLGEFRQRMRLTSIKLVGFKSFVDAVNVPFAGNMTAIVGPNGCGKSNIIDAVRWVMGESSAKTLRGESMTDVIFNGSTGRSPVGQASIELVFDNSDGTMGGAYSQYAEISVKRQVTRDSQSNYFFNGQKCRRRDISDLFLGTGLGPRSYAIIGQGMITRLVEARPEDLRSTLEEAAGVSKYKERRRETENRLRRTQENLDRLDDIREELDKQLERLKRQADAARRYQTLKDEEYRLKGELALLRTQAFRTQQHTQEQHVRELETQVEQEILGQRQCESRLEESRLAHDEVAAELETHQARFYETGAAIARIEQSIEHARSRDQQLAQDIEDARRELSELEQLGAQDDERRGALDERLESIVPELEEAQETLDMLQESLDAADEEAATAQQEWERFNESDRDVAHGAERAQDDVRRLENTIAELDDQIGKRRQQRQELPDVEALRGERGELREQLEAQDLDQEALESQREHLQQQREDVQKRLDDAAAQRDTQHSQLSRLQGELASVEALLDAALTDDDAALESHLARHDLAEAPRLAERLEVAAPWETVVAWALAPWLKARLATSSAMAEVVADAPPAELALLSGDDVAPVAGTLREQVDGAGALGTWLNTIHCAADEDAAWATRARLAVGESVVTPGGLWLGPDWVRRRGESVSEDGVLVQRRRRETLQADIAALEASLETLEETLQTAREAVEHSAAELESLRLQERDLGQRRQQLASREAGLASRLEQLDARSRELDDDVAQLVERHAERRLELEETRERWQAAMSDVDANSQTRERLENQRREAREKAQSLRQQVAPARERQQHLAMERQRLETERSGLDQQHARSRDQRERLAEKLAMLEEQRATLSEPEEETRERLDELLDRRSREEATLNASRDRAHQLAETLRDTEASRQQHERNLDGLRGKLEEARMQVQALTLKADTQDAHLEELGHDVDALREGLDPNATESAWQTQLDELGDKIRRLGAINLAAIEEYDQQAERRDYLEAQHAELSEAIETLEKAIRRIDQETRTRFKQTFDQVNAGFGELFPKVFGGGAAWLTLTGDDLLETGVAIMARPPGKKNTTIHLLSGGEKALTALSLIFAIFQLNPAPFCMLDEVDAPLDDANVGRYAKLVKEMSESVQFIYITHNKIAMEAAERLMGVTMQEAGVSRLVSVGIDEAATLVDT